MTLNFLELGNDSSIDPQEWFQTRAYQILNLVNTEIKTTFGRMAETKLFGSIIAGMATYQSDVDVSINIPTMASTVTLDNLEKVASTIRRIRHMKKVHVRRGRNPVVHGTFQVCVLFG